MTRDEIIRLAKEVGAQCVMRTDSPIGWEFYSDDELIRFAHLVAAEYKRDALRYRWLRKQDCIDWDQFQYADGFEFPDEVLNDYGEMVDSAVDAAMEKVK